MADITRYITEILGIVKFYRDYDKPEEKKGKKMSDAPDAFVYNATWKEL